MLDEDIQKLGRWSSESFRLYFTTSAQTLYNLNMNIQTGRPVALTRAWTNPPPPLLPFPFIFPIYLLLGHICLGYFSSYIKPRGLDRRPGTLNSRADHFHPSEARASWLTRSLQVTGPTPDVCLKILVLVPKKIKLKNPMKAFFSIYFLTNQKKRSSA